MSRPPPIGRGRLTRPRAYGHAGGAGRAEATPPGTSGAAGAGSHDPGLRHPLYKARGLPRAHLRAVRAGASCASFSWTPSAGGRPSARYEVRGSVLGAGEPAPVGSVVSMLTPVGSAALPTSVGPALISSSTREDPVPRPERPAHTRGLGNGCRGACRRKRVGAAVRAAARCPRCAGPAAPEQAELSLVYVLAMKESTASRAGLPFLGNELGRDAASPPPHPHFLPGKPVPFR